MNEINNAAESEQIGINSSGINIIGQGNQRGSNIFSNPFTQSNNQNNQTNASLGNNQNNLNLNNN